jgi:hypothetical protein
VRAVGGPAFITTPPGDTPHWEKVTSSIVLLALTVAARAYVLNKKQPALPVC